jgi:serine/threonine protein kinase
MEYVPGPSLKQLFRGKYPFSPHQISTIAQKAASALDYAHSMGIVHRDVKPGNILLKSPVASYQPPENQNNYELVTGNRLPATDFEVKLVDFGIARFEGSDLTREGLVIGSPSYMSPEQLRGKRVDGRSDQFSLGVVTYELITGQKPFPGDDIKAIGWQIINEDPTPPSRIRPDIPALWDEILFRVLAKDSNDRYPTISEFARALASQISEIPASGSDFRSRALDVRPEGSDTGHRNLDPDSSPPWAESSIVNSIIQSKTLEVRGWPSPDQDRGGKPSRIWLWYLLILLLLGGIIFALIQW